MFGQLTGKPSLRRFIIASAPIQKKFYSLGMGRNVTLSIYEVLETVSMVLTDKMPLYDLLCNSNYNIDNELDESSGPTLF